VIQRAETHRDTWYRDVVRWGQTNLTEIDPIRYDAAWWREHWKRTRIQGVIINAGGIVAYYPSRFELQHRAQFLGERDLYGEISAAAREDGLSVIARMDSNRADHRFYTEHPDWFTRDAEGNPYRAGDLYISCVFSPYYDTYLPGVLQEIIERYAPDGFADNSWSGLQRDRICYCVHCQRRFRELTGEPLPVSHDWANPVYRQWIRWNYDRRLEIWDINNATTKRHGGEHCLWIGMNAGEITAQSKHFRDYRAIAQRADLIFLDSQFRHPGQGFQRNGEMGAALHGMFGWNKLIPESMAIYGAGHPAFRLSSKSQPDARLWALDGFSGGIQPWWHHIGAYHDDRRQYRTAEPLFTWHEQHEAALLHREPVATVGVVWSQENVDYYGASHPFERYTAPWTGVTDALIRARIPYLPVHAGDIDREASRLQTLILPNVGALSDDQCTAIRRFVENGGGLIATGESSLYREDGTRRDNFALADLFAADATGTHHGSDSDQRSAWDEWSQHTYLRLSPERRRWIDGPQTGTEPEIDAPRHDVLAGFEETDTLSFGGRVEVVQPHANANVLATLVPSFPIYPPETSWMQYPASNIPALILHEATGQGRVAYLPADIDRAFSRNRLPDHATLLANLVRWSATDRIPLYVDGPGFLHCQMYRQEGQTILHIVNLTGFEVGGTPVAEHFPVGPLTVTIDMPDSTGEAVSAHLLVAGTSQDVTVKDCQVTFAIDRIVDHEVVTIG
jgi:hypothetical protein